MGEGILYLAASFWLGAVHAATPGHGKTIAATYIVGARGRPVDALVLGIFVTLSHTSGIVLVAILATVGSAWLIPQRVETYLALGTGLVVIWIGCWMLRTQLRLLRSTAAPERQIVGAADRDDASAVGAAHGHHHHDRPHFHGHGWGVVHMHDMAAITQLRPSLFALIGLGIAGGLLPDPGALAILLAALAAGKLVLGLLTVLVFSLGFASVLVLVGVVAAKLGRIILSWLSSRWVAWVQVGAAVVILGVGLVLTARAWQGVAAMA
jgi:nickel/cobalt transporter (NicO) family protein